LDSLTFALIDLTFFNICFLTLCFSSWLLSVSSESLDESLDESILSSIDLIFFKILIFKLFADSFSFVLSSLSISLSKFAIKLEYSSSVLLFVLNSGTKISL
jgi:hypothetical protein